MISPSQRRINRYDLPSRAIERDDDLFFVPVHGTSTWVGWDVRAATPSTTPTPALALVVLTRMPLGSVGGHLNVLLAAGTVLRCRSGREVFYWRTALGDALVASDGGPLTVTGPCKHRSAGCPAGDQPRRGPPFALGYASGSWIDKRTNDRGLFVAKGFGKSGLTLGYRISYRLRMIGLTIFGPAELGENSDPKIALARERAARVAQAHERRGS